MSSSVCLDGHRERGPSHGYERRVWTDRVAVTFGAFSSAEDAHGAAAYANLEDHPMSMTTTAPRYVSRARFSASDRPIPPDFDVRAFIDTRRATPEALAPSARLARWFESLAARLAGVRRSAMLALTLSLATGVGRVAGDDATEGARA
jgi:hypothetical protein